MNEDVTISPYELERLQKINRNKEFLKIIGLDQPAIAVERKKKTDSDPSKKTKKRKEPSNDYLEFMERRKSQRLSTKPTIKYIEIEGNNGEFVSKKRRKIGSNMDESILAAMNVPAVAEESTCHHCRKKTNLLKAMCSKCTLKFCHRCLFLKYDQYFEHVIQDSIWQCPVCQKTCTCAKHKTKFGTSSEEVQESSLEDDMEYHMSQDTSTLDSDIDEDEPPPIDGRVKKVQQRSKNSTDHFLKRQHKPALPLPTFPKLEKLVQSIVSKPKTDTTVTPTKGLFMNSPFMNGPKLTSHPFLAIHQTEEDSDLSVQDEDSENDEGDDQCEEDGVYYVDKILQKRDNGKGVTEYFVKWEEFDDSQSMWLTDKELVGCEDIIRAFEHDGSHLPHAKKQFQVVLYTPM
jgi:hypothetical protein